jgi:hypothetical protein
MVVMLLLFSSSYLFFQPILPKISDIHIILDTSGMLLFLEAECLTFWANHIVSVWAHPGSVQSDTANICWSLLGSDVCWLSFNLCWLQIMILAKSNSTKQSKIIKCTNDGLEAACIRSHMNVCQLGWGTCRLTHCLQVLVNDSRGTGNALGNIC